MTTKQSQMPPEIARYDFKSKLGYVALEAFFRICEDWNTTIDEQCQLLKVGLIELEELRKLPAKPLTREQLIRVRCFVLIYKESVRRTGSISKANREIRIARTGQPFLGKPPLKLMVNGGTIGIASACKALTGEGPEVKELLSRAS